MRLLLTRPKEDSENFARLLARRDIAATIEPMLSIEPVAGATVDLAGVQALLVTSANGLRAFASLEPRRDLHVLAVGDGSAAAARDAGFNMVNSAAGTVEDLADLVIGRLKPADGALLHAAGSKVAGDLGGRLTEAGFEVRRVVLYEARAAEALSPAVRRDLEEGAIDGVVFFSPRTAATFVSLANEAGLAADCASLTAVCLSPAVAAQAQALPWRSVVIADRPDQESLLVAVAGVPVAEDQRQQGRLKPAMSKTPESGDDATAQGPADPSDRETTGGATPWDKPAAESTTADTVDSEAPSEQVAEAPPPPRQRGGLARLVWTIAIAAIVGAVVASWPFWWHTVEPFMPPVVQKALQDPRLAGLAERVRQLEDSAKSSATDQTVAEEVARRAAGDAIQGLEAERARFSQQLDEVMQRIAALEQDTETVRQMVERAIAQGGGGDGGQVSMLTERLKELEANGADLKALSQRVGQLEQSQEVEVLTSMNQRLAGEIDRIAGRLGTLEEELPAADARAADRQALILAVGQLRVALGGSAAYSREIEALRRVAPNDPAVQQALDVLAPRAERGVPTLAALRERFDGLAGDIVHAANTGDEEDWFDKVVDRVSGLVKIRRVDGFDADDTSPDALVARAESNLAIGDLAAAVNALKKLEARPAEVAAPWLADAEARLAAERAIAGLHVHAISLLGSPAE